MPLTTGSFKKSTMWSMGLSIYSLILSLIIGPLTARALGPEMRGNLGYAEALLSIFLVFSQFGLRNVIVNELVRHPERQEETLGTAFVIRFFTTIVSMILVYLCALILKPDNQIIQLVAALETISLFFFVYEVLMYWFQSRLYIQHFAFISAVALTIQDIWKLYLVFNDPDVYKFALSNGLRTFLIFVALLIIFYKMNPGFRFKWNAEFARRYFRRGFQYALAGLGTEIYYKIDVFMVGNMIDSQNLAFYIVGLNISDMWQTIPLSISNNAQPVIAKHKGKDEKLYMLNYQTLLLGITLLCVFACLVAMVLGGPVISFLYGTQYLRSISVFLIIVWASVFSSLSAVRYHWLVCEKYDRYSKYFVLFGAVLDIILNYIFIKRYGVVGAALSTLITEACVFFVAPYLFKETSVSNSIYFSCFKCFPNLVNYIQTAIKERFSHGRI